MEEAFITRVAALQVVVHMPRAEAAAGIAELRGRGMAGHPPCRSTPSELRRRHSTGSLDRQQGPAPTVAALKAAHGHHKGIGSQKPKRQGRRGSVAKQIVQKSVQLGAATLLRRQSASALPAAAAAARPPASDDALGQFGGPQRLQILHELREYYDPQYRIAMLRHELRTAAAARRGQTAAAAAAAPLERVALQRMQEAVEMFALVDEDASGSISRAEFKALCKRLGIFLRDMELTNLMEFLDEDEDETLDVAEFSKWYMDDDPWLTQRRKDGHDIFSDARLLRRESLRFDTTVKSHLARFWAVVDGDGSGSIDFGEYVAFSINLQRVVQGQDLDVKAATATAWLEWEFDAQGNDTMDEHLFLLCFFQIADAWAEDLSSAAYCKFLGELFEATTRVGADGKAAWRWDDAKEEIPKVPARKMRRPSRHESSRASLCFNLGASGMRTSMLMGPLLSRADEKGKHAASAAAALPVRGARASFYSGAAIPDGSGGNTAGSRPGGRLEGLDDVGKLHHRFSVRRNTMGQGGGGGRTAESRLAELRLKHTTLSEGGEDDDDEDEDDDASENDENNDDSDSDDGKGGAAIDSPPDALRLKMDSTNPASPTLGGSRLLPDAHEFLGFDSPGLATASMASMGSGMYGGASVASAMYGMSLQIDGRPSTGGSVGFAARRNRGNLGRGGPQQKKRSRRVDWATRDTLLGSGIMGASKAVGSRAAAVAAAAARGSFPPPDFGRQPPTRDLLRSQSSDRLGRGMGRPLATSKSAAMVFSGGLKGMGAGAAGKRGQGLGVTGLGMAGGQDSGAIMAAAVGRTAAALSSAADMDFDFGEASIQGFSGLAFAPGVGAAPRPVTAPLPTAGAAASGSGRAVVALPGGPARGGGGGGGGGGGVGGARAKPRRDVHLVAPVATALHLAPAAAPRARTADGGGRRIVPTRFELEQLHSKRLAQQLQQQQQQRAEPAAFRGIQQGLGVRAGRRGPPGARRRKGPGRPTTGTRVRLEFDGDVLSAATRPLPKATHVQARERALATATAMAAGAGGGGAGRGQNPKAAARAPIRQFGFPQRA